jgi:hypothetical protein
MIAVLACLEYNIANLFHVVGCAMSINKQVNAVDQLSANDQGDNISLKLQSPDSLFRKMIETLMSQKINEEVCVQSLYDFWVKLAQRQDALKALAFSLIHKHDNHGEVTIMPNLFRNYDEDYLADIFVPLVSYKDLYNQYFVLEAKIKRAEGDVLKAERVLDNHFDTVFETVEYGNTTVAAAIAPERKVELHQLFKNAVHQHLREVAKEHVERYRATPVSDKNLSTVATQLPPQPKFSRDVLPVVKQRIANSHRCHRLPQPEMMHNQSLQQCLFTAKHEDPLEALFTRYHELMALQMQQQKVLHLMESFQDQNQSLLQQRVNPEPVNPFFGA